MIVKKIPARPSTRNVTTERAAHARHLIDYLRLPEKVSAYKDYMVDYMLGQKLGDTSLERLFHIGGRGFVSDTIEGQRAEMIAIAQTASRSRNPVDHWLLSWREGEFPSPEQVDAAVALFVEHLGVAGQPCIYACHGDTMNRHVHVALNRYDAARGRMIEINGGFTLEAAHQAVALIVDRFGWAAEADARYHIVDGHPVLTPGARDRVNAGIETLRPAAAAFENRTGYSSAQRIAQDEALPLIDAARSWAELHEGLAARGIRYEATGTNGAALVVGDDGVKASFVHRRITRGALTKRLGVFVPRDVETVIVPRDVERDRLKQAFRADEYRVQREAWSQWRARRTALGRAQSGQSSRMKVLRAEAKSRATTAERPERPPPDLESWYYENSELDFAARWRHRRKVNPLPVLRGSDQNRQDLPESIDGYRAYPCSDGVRYARNGQGTAFIDRGKQIDVMPSDKDAILAAIKLAAIKFDGRVTVIGPAHVRERIYAVAEANGLSEIIANEDFVSRGVERQPSLPASTVKQAFDNRPGTGTRRRQPAIPVQLPPEAVRSRGPDDSRQSQQVQRSPATNASELEPVDTQPPVAPAAPVVAVGNETPQMVETNIPAASVSNARRKESPVKAAENPRPTLPPDFVSPAKGPRSRINDEAVPSQKDKSR